MAVEAELLELRGASGPVHAEKTILLSLLARLVANLSRLGGRAIARGLKLTIGVEDKVST